MSKHTQGPLHVFTCSGFTYINKDTRSLARMECQRYASEAEVEADAIMFAASPELLAFAELYKSGRGTPSMLDEMSNAAIAKATGKPT